jgi:midasin
VPLEELTEIITQKCKVPKSRSLKMIKVMEQLQLYRSSHSIFSGKESIITVRDLIKWANRVNMDDGLTMEKFALEGFLVLAERSRNLEDKDFIRATISKALGVPIDEKQFYEEFYEQHIRTDILRPREGVPAILESQTLKRLAALVFKCLRNKEPVLLVGETGCGKTTLCQVFAAMNSQELFSINCHQNTETADFIGCMRTKRGVEALREKLAETVADLTREVLA